MNRRDISAENLSIWHQAAAENRELRLLQIAELAQDCTDIGQGTESNEAWARLPTPTLPCSELVPPADSFARAMALDEQMAFCRALPKEHSEQALPIELKPSPAAPRVARLTGPIFDSAFRRLSPLLGLARPVYLSSLNELLEELAAGNADFALLPIEDAKGVRFLHFYEEFDRLELHASHTCEISSEENRGSIVFALLSKQYFPTGKMGGLRLSEYRLSGQEQGLLNDLLCAAAQAEMKLRRIDSVPDPSFEDGFVHHVILCADKEEQEALLSTYLNLYLPRVTKVGHYIHIA